MGYPEPEVIWFKLWLCKLCCSGERPTAAVGQLKVKGSASREGQQLSRARMVLHDKAAMLRTKKRKTSQSGGSKAALERL